MLIGPMVEVMETPAPSMLTPRPSTEAEPPVPLSVIVPTVAMMSDPLTSSIPGAKLIPAAPCPRRLMLPAPETNWALLSLIPSGSVAVPMAAVVLGSAPPPSVMLPPWLAMTVPVPRLMAPAPLASRLELRITLSELVVETSALLAKRMLLLARTSSVLPAAPVSTMLALTVTSPAAELVANSEMLSPAVSVEPAFTVTLPPVSDIAPVVVAGAVTVNAFCTLMARLLNVPPPKL